MAPVTIGKPRPLLTIKRFQVGEACGAAVLFALLLFTAAPSRAQEADALAEDLDAIAADTDPTKPVILSVREEFYKLSGSGWQNVVILRGDQLIFEKHDLLGHRKGLILRADLPLVSYHAGGSIRTGLGDMYGQALLIPRVTDAFLIGRMLTERSGFSLKA